MSLSLAISAVAAVAVITYAARAGLIIFLAGHTLPTGLTDALRYVGPAVLAALTVNLVAGGNGVDGIEAEEIAAVTAAVAVAAVTRNLIATLAAGMVMLWLLLWIV